MESARFAMELVAIDVGGTHARFAIARIRKGDGVSLAEPVVLATDDYDSLQDAWRDFECRLGHAAPRAAAVALAGPVNGPTIRLTNNRWTIQRDQLERELGLQRLLLLNDFAAVTHTAACVGPNEFVRLAGPDRSLPETGTISVIGPGTGLGVACFSRDTVGYRVQATEGGHIGFAPVDAVEDAILVRMRARFPRVSAERIIAGPGIVPIYETLAALRGAAAGLTTDRAIWDAGLQDTDPLAVDAVDRFCMLLGGVAGDLALAHGANGVVIAGGLGYRIRERLLASAFGERFRAKGRYEAMMSDLPVKLLTHPQPGLLGAALAFAGKYGRH